MTPQEKIFENLLKENLKISKENNKILKKMRRTHIIDMWSRILFFLFLVGVPIFIYRYYLEEYVTDFRNIYIEIKSDVEAIKNIPDRLRDFSQKTQQPEGF